MRRRPTDLFCTPRGWRAGISRLCVWMGSRVVRSLMYGLLALFLLAEPVYAQVSTPSFPKPRGGLLGGSLKKIDQTQPMYLQGDELIYDNANGRVTARGNVEIYYNKYVLLADRVIYDQRRNTLTAIGNVQIKEPNGAVIKAERITLTDDFREGFVQSLSVIAKDDSRIAAERAVRADGSRTIYERGQFTPCKPCRDDPSKAPLWRIKARRVIHDQKAASISYQDAAFEFMGVPLLWFPYFSHPDPTVKRRSGFLVPEISHSTELGVTIEVPYYFALADNYDFTFHPKYTSKQGVLWQGHWRHRTATGRYFVRFAAINQDDADETTSIIKGPLEHNWRGSIHTRGAFALSSWWRYGWDITLESDDAFRRFYDLDNILQTDRVNTIYLKGISDRNYFSASFYHFGGLLISDSKDSNSESRVHPVVDYNYLFANPVVGGELSFDANVLSLSRDLGQDNSRVIAQLNWRRKLIDPLGQVFTPFAQLRGDAYYVTNVTDPVTGLTSDRETVTRGMATAGLTYQYPFISHTAAGSHILEPIAQVLVRPNSVTQTLIPNEDALSLVFDDTLLFDTDKFSGYDRIETGTRANVGLQYTFQAYSGSYARLVLGQSYQLAGTNPFAVGSGLDTRRSDYVAGLYFAPSSSFKVISQSRFNETAFALRRQDVSVLGRFGPLRGSASYAYTKDDPLNGLFSSQQELLVAAQAQLSEYWFLTGTMRYDIDDAIRLQDSVGVKYADECFVLEVTYGETFIKDISQDIRPDQRVMVRFELKHLGSYGTNTDQLTSQFAPNQPPKF